MSTRRARRPYTVAQLIRRRRRVRWAVVVVLGILGASSLLDRGGAFTYRGDDWANFDRQECEVLAVADGDTLTLRPTNGGREAKVRLLGLDAPEAHDKQTGGPAYWSDRATAYLTDRAQGQRVTARLEPTQTRDRYGRLLAYVFVGENENLNLTLVGKGHAYAHRRFPHTLKSQFEQAENDARTKRLGLWKDVREDQMPVWRRRWLTEVREEKAKR